MGSVWVVCDESCHVSMTKSWCEVESVFLSIAAVSAAMAGLTKMRSMVLCLAESEM